MKRTTLVLTVLTLATFMPVARIVIGYSTDPPPNCDGQPFDADADLIVLSPPKFFNDMTWPNSDDMADVCDPDDDNDGLYDVEEQVCRTDPRLRDTDGDHAIDSAECALSIDPTDHSVEPPATLCSSPGDRDGDGVFDAREVCYYNSDPSKLDTDGDGLNDGCEIHSINGDRRVNVIDLQQIAMEQTVYLSPGYPVQVNFDVTKNGSIDVIDLQQAAAAARICP